MVPATHSKPLVALRKYHIHHILHIRLNQTTISIRIPTETVSTVKATITLTLKIPSVKLSVLPPPSLLSQSRLPRQVEPRPLLPHPHQPEGILDPRRALLPKPRNLSFAVRQMERRIPRSVLGEDVDHYYPSKGNRLARSESSVLVYDASSSRRPVIRVNHALGANPRTQDFGKFPVHELISRILATL